MSSRVLGLGSSGKVLVREPSTESRLLRFLHESLPDENRLMLATADQA